MAVLHALQMVPALQGHRIDQDIAPGVAAVSVAYGYCLWIHRGRKGWQGALAGRGVFLVICGAGTLISGRKAATELNTCVAASTPTLGLLAPVDSFIPPEANILYPGGVHFRSLSLGLARMTPEGYDQVIDRIAPMARLLAQQGAAAITLMGTSLSFYNGATFNQELTQRIALASGCPAVTMSTAVIEGLRNVGAKRLAVATAYNEEVNRRLKAFLIEEGFEVLAIRGLGVERVEDIHSVTRDGLFKFSADVFAAANGADAVLVSCGGLHTLELLEPLELHCKVPVVSSLPHALRAGVRLLGLSGQVQGYGILLSQSGAGAKSS